MPAERLNFDALVPKAHPDGYRIPRDHRDPLNPTAGAVWNPASDSLTSAEESGVRFTSEDVAEEAVLEPQAKKPVLRTIPGGAPGWRQRRRLHSRRFCR